MRRVIHRILSALPALGAAYLAVWATAFPKRAQASYNSVSELLVSEARFFWYCIAGITAYAILWWLTSLEPRSRRQRIQAGLRPHYEALNRFQLVLRGGEWSEVDAVIPEFQQALNSAGNWIAENMSEAASVRFNQPNYESKKWYWPGDPPPGAWRERCDMLSLNTARLEALDAFLRYDGWDGEQPALGERLRRRIGKWINGKGGSTAS